MKKTNIIFFMSFLYMSGSTFVQAEVVAGVEVPSIAEMKDPNSKCGLNLELVKKRRDSLSERGVRSDISVDISTLQKYKAQLKVAIEKKVELERMLPEIKPKKGFFSKKKSNVEKQQEAIPSDLKGRIQGNERIIADLRERISNKTSEIMKALDLPSERVVNIPAAQSFVFSSEVSSSSDVSYAGPSSSSMSGSSGS